MRRVLKRAIVRDLLEAEEQLDRTFFVNRRDGPAVAREIRAREFGPVYGLAGAGAFWSVVWPPRTGDRVDGVTSLS